MVEDEDALLASALGAVAESAAGRGGRLGATLASRLLKTAAHECDLILPLPLVTVTGRVANILAVLGRVVDQPRQQETGPRRIRAIVRGGYRGANPVVVTLDLAPHQVGGTSIKLRAAAKEGIVKQRSAEKTAKVIAELLSRHDNTVDAPPAHTCFEVDDPDGESEFTDEERAFTTDLRAYSASWPADVEGEIGRADGGEGLLACVSLADPAEPPRHLIDVGVHLVGDRVRGDRLHNQLGLLPARPSPWALVTIGTPGRLAELAARWFREVLEKPIVLYVWLHRGHAYAARYAFADSGETLSQCYAERLAPVGQAEELIAAGHVHGNGWIQTAGLPTPTFYLHIRGDLTKGTIPSGVQATTGRGPLPRLWYE